MYLLLVCCCNRKDHLCFSWSGATRVRSWMESSVPPEQHCQTENKFILLLHRCWLKGHSSWLSLALRCLYPGKSDSSASQRSRHIEATPEKMEKGRQCCFAMLLNSTCLQSKLPLNNIAWPYIFTVRCAKEEKEKRKSNSSPHSWQPGSPPGLWPGFLQFSMFLCYLACPSYLLCLLPSMFCILIPTLRISLPFLSPLYFSVISCKMRFYEK